MNDDLGQSRVPGLLDVAGANPVRLIVSSYLLPDEWMIGFSWWKGGYHQERVRAGTHNEAEKMGKQMRVILEAALDQCRSIADKTFNRGVMFDD